MKYKYILISCNLVLIVLILFSIGIIRTQNSGIGFCILKVSCGEGEAQIEIRNFTFVVNGEGEVKPGDIYSESVFKTLGKVIKTSEEKYNNIIKEISSEDSFDILYKKYIKIFKGNYSLDIDNYYGGDYIQNINELVFNNYHGDCDDYAVWLYLIAKEQKFKVRYVIGFSSIGGHAWVQIKINGEWVDYDSTLNKKGINAVSQHYYNIFYYNEGEKDE